MSACSGNAQRVSLEDLLLLAFPSDYAAVCRACAAGDAKRISAYLNKLEATGVSTSNTVLLYWPLSDGMSDILEISRQPHWIALLKDTHVSATFAVVSDRCLTYNSGTGAFRRTCSGVQLGPDFPVLLTTIELNPDESLRPPLEPDTEVRLSEGVLDIRNRDVPAQLAFLEPYKIWQSAKFNKAGLHWELVSSGHASPHLVEVCIMAKIS